MTALDTMLAALREERGEAGGGSGNDPDPTTRTRGTTSEAGRLDPKSTKGCAQDHSASDGRRGLPDPLPVPPALRGINLGRWYDPNPTLVFWYGAEDVEQQLAFRDAAMRAMELEEGPVSMQTPAGYAVERPPLWRLRLPNGKPNYASAYEQARFLKDAGWLDWSVGKNKKPVEWEEWVMALDDPRRVPPFDVDPELLHELQRAELATSPTEKLGRATIDTDEPYELDVDGWREHDDEGVAA